MATILSNKKSVRKWLAALFLLLGVFLCGATFYLQSLGMKANFAGNQIMGNWKALSDQATVSIASVRPNPDGGVDIVVHDDSPNDELNDGYYLRINDSRYDCGLYVKDLLKLTCSGPAFNTGNLVYVGLYTPDGTLVYSSRLLLRGLLAFEIPPLENAQSGESGNTSISGDVQGTDNLGLLGLLKVAVTSHTDQNTEVSVDISGENIVHEDVNGNVTVATDVNNLDSGDSTINANVGVSDPTAGCLGDLVCAEINLNSNP